MDDPTRLSSEEVADRVRALSEWRVENIRLVKDFSFEDFMGAIGFVNRVAEVAEAEGHHPDLEVGWGGVKVSLTTHSAGGLTENDFRVAAAIDRL